MTKLEQRIIDISFYRKLSHLGSVLTALPIIDDIYKRKPYRFVLSSGHAALALYCVLEKYYGYNAEELFEKHGVHPNRDLEHKIYASTGSLGHGIGIALGMALAHPNKKIYCLISDGECAEGSLWEALRIAKERKIKNLKVICNINGFGAYRKIDKSDLARRLRAYGVKCIFTKLPDWDFLKDSQEAHYHILNEDEYEKIIRTGTS